MESQKAISIAAKHLMIALGVITSMLGIIGSLIIYVHNVESKTQEKFNNTMERVIERMEKKLSETVIDVAIIKTILKEKEKIDIDATRAQQEWQQKYEEYLEKNSKTRGIPPGSSYLKNPNNNNFFAFE